MNSNPLSTLHYYHLFFFLLFFFFNDTATTEIYTLSLHDALPIYVPLPGSPALDAGVADAPLDQRGVPRPQGAARSEEHTSELQSRRDLVCRLLLEKKKKRVSTLYRVYDTHPKVVTTIR